MSSRRKLPKVFEHPRSPYWQYDFEIAGHRFQGRLPALGPRAECHKATAQKELERVWREEWDRIERTKRSGRQPMTISEAAQRWWEMIASQKAELDLGPPECEGRPLHWLVQELGASTPLHRITGQHVDALIAKRRKRLMRAGTDAKGKPLFRQVGPRTINRTVVLLLRRILRKAQRAWNVEIPNMPIWSEHIQKTPARKPRVITFAEQAVLDEHERPWLRAIREFALLTSLRLSECISIQWRDIDFERRLLWVKTKGGKERQIPMTDPLTALLRSLKGQHPIWVFTYVAERTNTNAKSGQHYVRGQRYPVTKWYLRSAQLRDWAKAGVDGSFHDLRRTAARQVNDATRDIRAAQGLLGHNDVKTTEIYLGVSGEHEVRASMQARDEYVARMRAEASKGKQVVRLQQRGKR
jgi:integrase